MHGWSGSSFWQQCNFLSVCDIGVLWPNGWMDQDETWHAGRPWSWPQSVRWEPSSPYPKGDGARPQFRPISIVAKFLDGSRCNLVGRYSLSPSDIVLNGDPAPFPKRGQSLQFSAHICCGQMAGWIKMPRGKEVGLGPGHIVLDGDPAAPHPNPKGHSPQFLAHICCGQMAWWIKMPLGMQVGLGPTTLC